MAKSKPKPKTKTILVTKKTRVLMSRAEFAKEIGISISEIRRRERQGYLAPVARGLRDQALYSMGQVKYFKNVLTGKLYSENELHIRKQHAAIAYTTEEATEVFEMLRDDTPFETIVLRSRIHPRSVQAIAYDYATMVGGVVLSGETVSAINSLPLDASFPIAGEDQIFALLKEASTDGCSRCDKRPKKICLHCAPVVVNELDI